MTDSNPLCHIFPIEMSDFIFQHFTGAELLKMSEASPSFYNYTAASEACMKKIAIKLEDSAITESDKRVLMESDRKYKHLQVSLSPDLFKPTREILAVPGRKWLSVVAKAENMRRRTIDDVGKFFKSIQADVELLLMRNVGPERLQETAEVAFLQLKNFESCLYPFKFGETRTRSKELYLAMDQEVLMNLAKKIAKELPKMGDTRYSIEFWQTIASFKVAAPIYPGLETVSCSETIIAEDGYSDTEVTTYLQIKPWY